MTASQPSLFPEPKPSAPTLPEGFRYWPEFISVAEEAELAARFAELPLREFEFQGYLGKRRVVSFGWRYDFNDRELRRIEDIPAFLTPLRDRAAAFAGLQPDAFVHALITEYSPGAPIGWHRDRPDFGDVAGISLLAPARFRLRRKAAGRSWERAAVTLEPRSAYLLRGPVRTEWEHSIPPMETLRYSVTFRSLRGAVAGGGRLG